MSSGAISMHLGSLWKKPRIFEVESGKRNFYATFFRKAASTCMRKFKIGDSQEDADLMGHSLATAEKYYYTRCKRETAASAGKAVRSSFRNQDIISTPLTPKNA